jgi:uncharacterized protein YcaQ
MKKCAARLVHLAAQGLLERPARPAAKCDVLEAVRRMAVLQLDSISVVARSPYLVLFSRLGAYEAKWLDELLAEGRLFEYWAHEASLLPIEDYGLLRHRMLDPRELGWKYRSDWVAANQTTMHGVLEHVRAHGPVRSADFGRRGHGSAQWWGWKPEKRALEYLLTAGELMVARRDGFQRVYDLRERVHPGWCDDMLEPREAAEKQLVLRAVHALGIARVRWIADYYRMDRRRTQQLVHELVADGELLEVPVAGWDDVAVVHPAQLDLLDAASSGRLEATHTTLLSPFDPVVWDRVRVQQLFDFDYRLECYIPAPKRRFGYYVLPVLRRGALIGRLDARADRRTGEFEVKAVYLEDGVDADDAMVHDVAQCIHEAAAWHGTSTVRVTRSRPAGLRQRLQRALCALA